MKSFVQTLIDLIPFLQAYPPWVHWVVVVWMLTFVILLAALLLAYDPARLAGRQQSRPPERVTQRTTATDSPGSTIYQAGRDLTVVQQQASRQGEAKTRVLQAAQLAELLKQFNDIFVRVENGPETEVFAEELRSSFRLAGWRTNSRDIILDPARFAFEGIKILVHDAPLSLADSAPDAADAIVRELRRQNFLANRLPSDTATQENFIRIRIGSKQS